MKGFRFYQEYDQYRWRKNAKPTGNVIALHVPEVAKGRIFVGEVRECVGAVSDKSGSPCMWSDASMTYISKRCKNWKNGIIFSACWKIKEYSEIFYNECVP